MGAGALAEIGVIDTQDIDKSRIYEFREVAVDPADHTKLVLTNGGGRIGALVEGDGSGFVRCRNGCPIEPSVYGWFTPAGLKLHQERAPLAHVHEAAAWQQRRTDTWQIIRKCADRRLLGRPEEVRVLDLVRKRDRSTSFGIRDCFFESFDELVILCDAFNEYITEMRTKVRVLVADAAGIGHTREDAILEFVKGMYKTLDTTFQPCPAISLSGEDACNLAGDVLDDFAKDPTHAAICIKMVFDSKRKDAAAAAAGKRKDAPEDLAVQEPPSKLQKLEHEST